MLTTKKFIKEVQNLGFATAEYMNIILIRHESREVALIGKCKIFCVNTEYPSFNNLPEELKEKLYNLIDNYTRTPLEDREEPQKFYLKFDIKSSDSYHYLNYKEFLNSIEIHNKVNNLNGYKTQFTQKEVDELKKKLGVTFINLKQIPVEEVEE